MLLVFYFERSTGEREEPEEPVYSFHLQLIKGHISTTTRLMEAEISHSRSNGAKRHLHADPRRQLDSAPL